MNRRMRAVHPHGCGEYEGRSLWAFRFDGSPPRVWGIWKVSNSEGVILPVHPLGCGEYDYVTGNPDLDVPVHPHGCGEYFRLEISNKTKRGSPPRVWGILSGCLQWLIALPVHPHGCGEYFFNVHIGDRDVRFTPTGVGNIFAYGHFAVGLPRFTPTGVGNMLL